MTYLPPQFAATWSWFPWDHLSYACYSVHFFFIVSLSLEKCSMLIILMTSYWGAMSSVSLVSLRAKLTDVCWLKQEKCFANQSNMRQAPLPLFSIPLNSSLNGTTSPRLYFWHINIAPLLFNNWWILNIVDSNRVIHEVEKTWIFWHEK